MTLKRAILVVVICIVPVLSEAQWGSFSLGAGWQTGSVHSRSSNKIDSPFNYGIVDATGGSSSDYSYDGKSGFTVYSRWMIPVGTSPYSINVLFLLDQFYFNRKVSVTGANLYSDNFNIKYSCSFSMKEKYRQTSLTLPLLLGVKVKEGRHASLLLFGGPALKVGLSSMGKTSGLLIEDRYVYDTSSHDYTGGLEWKSDIEAEANLYTGSYTVDQTFSSTGNHYHGEYTVPAPLNRLSLAMCVGIGLDIEMVEMAIMYSIDVTNVANARYWEASGRNQMNMLVNGAQPFYTTRHRIHDYYRGMSSFMINIGVKLWREKR